MQPLSSIPEEQRQKWITLLARELRAKSLPEHLARAIEHHYYSSRQEKICIGDNSFVCRYGDQDILDIDFPILHETAAVHNYTANLRRIAWAINSGNSDKKTTAEDWITSTDDSFVENTEHSEWERDFYAKKEFAKSVLQGNNEAKEKIVGIFACPRCKSFDVDTEQKQTRSADEPMTVFCTCNACEKRFIR